MRMGCSATTPSSTTPSAPLVAPSERSASSGPRQRIARDRRGDVRRPNERPRGPPRRSRRQGHFGTRPCAPTVEAAWPRGNLRARGARKGHGSSPARRGDRPKRYAKQRRAPPESQFGVCSTNRCWTRSIAIRSARASRRSSLTQVSIRASFFAMRSASVMSRHARGDTHDVSAPCRGTPRAFAPRTRGGGNDRDPQGGCHHGVRDERGRHWRR